MFTNWLFWVASPKIEFSKACLSDAYSRDKKDLVMTNSRYE